MKTFITSFFAILFNMFVVSASAQSFSGGIGTQNLPYLISNQVDLSRIMTKVSSSGNPDTLYFQMTADISMMGTWTPMGSSGSPFRGHFDGQHYSITNLQVAVGNGSDRGLFGKIVNATISRLSVETVSSVIGVEANSNGGILVGSAVGGVISEVRTSGFVKATDVGCGGLAGSISGTTVFNCRSTANVGLAGNNSSEFGGLVGTATNGSIISQCYATGDVIVGTTGSSGTKAGGLVGINTNSTISDCFATGTVTSAMTEVGTVSSTGPIYRNSSSSATPCTLFAAETFIAVPIYLGGLVGSNTGTGLVERSYASGNVVTNTLLYDIAQISFSSDPGCSNNTTYNLITDGGKGYPDYFAGVVGFNEGTVTNCVANNPAIEGGGRLVGGGTVASGGSTTASTVKATYTGFNWDFSADGVWTIASGAYPLLQKSLINKFVTYTDMCSGVAKTPSPIIASFNGSATGVFIYDLTAWRNGTPTILVSDGTAPFNNIPAHAVPVATEDSVYIKVKTTTTYDPVVTFDTIVATVHPQPTARIVACDTTLCYGYPQDSAMIKVELTGTAPFSYTYIRYDAANTGGLNIAKSDVNPTHDPHSQGNLYWEDRFPVLPDTISRTATSPAGGDRPVYTGFNLAASINVTDYWGCVSGVTTALPKPDTVTVNPDPLVVFPYLQWHGTGQNDTVLCNESEFLKKVFQSPIIAPAFADSMHYDWTLVNTGSASAAEIGMSWSTGLDSVPTFQVTNDSPDIMYAKFKVTPSFTNKFGGRCVARSVFKGLLNPSDTTVFGVTVNPTPKLTPLPGIQDVISLFSTKKIQLKTQIASDTVWYAWDNSHPEMGLPAVYDSISPTAVPNMNPILPPPNGGGYGAYPNSRDYIPSFTAVNNGPVPIYDTIRIRSYFVNRALCEGNDTAAVIKILPQLNAITTHPQDADLCDTDGHLLEVVAAGYVYDYQWYLDGDTIVGATEATYRATLTGTYHVHVNGASDTIASNTAFVKFGYSPVFVTNLRDSTVSSGPITLKIKASGEGLSYRWYFGANIIADAITDSITVREGGYYRVVVSNACGSIESYHAYLQIDYVEPIINRRVLLSSVEGVITAPFAGEYYVRSREHFTFDMWAAEGYSLNEVKVSTDKGNPIETVTIPDTDRMRVTVKYVNDETVIRIEGAGRSGQVGNPHTSQEARVWSHDGMLYVHLLTPTEISVYTSNGMLHLRRRLPAGDTTLSLPPGIYLIRVSGIPDSKVIIQ